MYQRLSICFAGERPFECDICQKRFTLKHSMMRHRKKHAGAPPRSFDDDEDSNGLEEKSKHTALYTYRPDRRQSVSKSHHVAVISTHCLCISTFSAAGMDVGCAMFCTTAEPSSFWRISSLG